jgi:hypothetical protein
VPEHGVDQGTTPVPEAGMYGYARGFVDNNEEFILIDYVKMR